MATNNSFLAIYKSESVYYLLLVTLLTVRSGRQGSYTGVSGGNVGGGIEVGHLEVSKWANAKSVL